MQTTSQKLRRLARYIEREADDLRVLEREQWRSDATSARKKIVNDLRDAFALALADATDDVHELTNS